MTPLIGSRQPTRVEYRLTRLVMALMLALACAPAANATYYLDSQLGSTGSAEAQFFAPNGIASASGGDTYVAESGNSRIQQFDSDGSFVQTWGWRGRRQQRLPEMQLGLPGRHRRIG